MPVAEWTPLYSNYDHAIVDYIREFTYKGKPILCVFATPERAFSQAALAIKKRTGIDHDLKTIPLPIFSINRVSQIFDPTRYVRYHFNREFPISGESAFHHVERPRPEKVTYDVSLWARNLRDIDSVYGQMVRTIRADCVHLPVEHPEPFGNLYCQAILADPRNMSVLEPERDQRTLRRVFPFVIEAWICYEPTEVGRIEHIEVELWDSDDLETGTDLLDTIHIVGTEDDGEQETAVYGAAEYDLSPYGGAGYGGG